MLNWMILTVAKSDQSSYLSLVCFEYPFRMEESSHPGHERFVPHYQVLKKWVCHSAKISLKKSKKNRKKTKKGMKVDREVRQSTILRIFRMKNWIRRVQARRRCLKRVGLEKKATLKNSKKGIYSMRYLKKGSNIGKMEEKGNSKV